MPILLNQNILDLGGFGLSKAYSHYCGSVTLTATGTSDYIVIPHGTSSTTVAVIPGTASTAKAEFTNDSLDCIADGTETWHDVGDGNVTVKTILTTQAALTAIRMVGVGKLTVTVA